MYEEMAALFPDSKFVLSLRKDEETWLRSVKTHFGRGKWLPYEFFYGADVFEGNEGVIRDSYRSHTGSVREFFEDKPGRMVELNIDAGDVNWEVLCRVAVCPEDMAALGGFPRSNSAESWDSGAVVGGFGWLRGWIVTRTEEWVSKVYYGNCSEWTRHFLRLCWRLYDAVETMMVSAYFELMPLFSQTRSPDVSSTSRSSI